MERETTRTEYANQDLWSLMESSWPGAVVKNKENFKFGPVSNVCIVLCPLYKKGDIKRTDILDVGESLEESRVFGKTKAYEAALRALSFSLQKTSSSLRVNFVIANKGVLLERNPVAEDYEKLKYHNELYTRLIDEWAQIMGFEYILTDYFERGIDFPEFVRVTQKIPKNTEHSEDINKNEPFLLIEYLNRYLKPVELIQNNGNNRHVAKSLIKAFGLNAAFWLTAGYLVFDHKIPEIIGENGIYIVSERFDPLYSIVKFTPNLEKLTRIQLKA